MRKSPNCFISELQILSTFLYQQILERYQLESDTGFIKLAENYSRFALEYHVFSLMVTDKLLYCNNQDELANVLQDIIALTELLEEFTADYLAIKRDARRLKARRLQYQAILEQLRLGAAAP